VPIPTTTAASGAEGSVVASAAAVTTAAATAAVTAAMGATVCVAVRQSVADDDDDPPSSTAVPASAMVTSSSGGAPGRAGAVAELSVPHGPTDGASPALGYHLRRRELESLLRLRGDDTENEFGPPVGTSCASVHMDADARACGGRVAVLSLVDALAARMPAPGTSVVLHLTRATVIPLSFSSALYVSADQPRVDAVASAGGAQGQVVVGATMLAQPEDGTTTAGVTSVESACDRMFRCERCGKFWVSESRLRLHQAVPCEQCPRCKAWFSSAAVMRNHLARAGCSTRVDVSSARTASGVTLTAAEYAVRAAVLAAPTIMASVFDRRGGGVAQRKAAWVTGTSEWTEDAVMGVIADDAARLLQRRMFVVGWRLLPMCVEAVKQLADLKEDRCAMFPYCVRPTLGQVFAFFRTIAPPPGLAAHHLPGQHPAGRAGPAVPTRSAKARHGRVQRRRWTKEEDNKILRQLDMKVRVMDVQCPGRTTAAIKVRCATLNKRRLAHMDAKAHGVPIRLQPTLAGGGSGAGAGAGGSVATPPSMGSSASAALVHEQSAC